MCPAKQGKIEDTETFINEVKVNASNDKIENASKDFVSKSYVAPPVDPYKNYH